MAKTGLVVSAHPGDFVWRAGGAIALHARRGYRVKIVCLAFGELRRSQFAWKHSRALTLEKGQGRPQGRGRDAPRPPSAPRWRCRCRRLSVAPDRCAYGAADRYLPRTQSELCADALAGRSLQCRPSSSRRLICPGGARIARASAMGHKPQAEYSYAAPPVFLFEPHAARDVQLQAAR